MISSAMLQTIRVDRSTLGAVGRGRPGGLATFERMNVHADVARIAALVPGEPAGADHIDLSGPSYVGASASDVDGLLAATAVHSIAAIAALERGTSTPRAIDLEHLLAFCTTHVEVDGEEVPAWDELSGVYETAGGRHLQVHCNFPHHAAGVVERLECAPNRAALASAIGERDAFELEAELISDGLIGAMVRSLAEWDSHPHALATRNLPLVSIDQVGEAASWRPPLVRGVSGFDRPSVPLLDGF
jgi:hypothetical protein